MPIQVICPYCDKHINAPDKFAGKTAKCPGCKERIEIPADDDMDVPDFGEESFDDDVQSVGIGPVEMDVAPAGPAASPYASPKTTSRSDRTELQRVKIVGIRLPFMDMLWLVVQSYLVVIVLSIAAAVVLSVLFSLVGLSLR